MKILNGTFEIKKDSQCFTLIKYEKSIAKKDIYSIKDKNIITTKKGDVIVSKNKTYHTSFTQCLHKIVEETPKEIIEQENALLKCIELLNSLHSQINQIENFLKNKKS
jgi:hypothetical protein